MVRTAAAGGEKTDWILTLLRHPANRIPTISKLFIDSAPGACRESAPVAFNARRGAAQGAVNCELAHIDIHRQWYDRLQDFAILGELCRHSLSYVFDEKQSLNHRHQHSWNARGLFQRTAVANRV